MSQTETLATVTRIFRAGEKQYGCTDLEAVAATIAQETGYPHPNALVFSSRRVSRPDHLYPGAVDTVRGLLDQGDHVTIWTLGHLKNQPFKVARTGINRLGPGVSSEIRSRFSTYVDMNKVEKLADPIEKALQKGARSIAIVDDKAGNVLGLKNKVQGLKDQISIPKETDIRLVWSRQGPYRDRVPSGMSVDDVRKDIETIDDIRELLDLRKAFGENIAWLLDFDHTLFDTTQYNQEMYQRVAMMIDAYHQQAQLQTDTLNGLNQPVFAG